MSSQLTRLSPALIAVPLVLLLAAIISSVVIIETGHVGVDRTLGTIAMKERSPGMSFKLPVITTVTEVSTKEIPLDFNDLTPKAKDNLSLQDLDLSIYYRVEPDKVAETMVKYSNGSRFENGVTYPGYNVVFREARRAIYETVSKLESLSIHRERDIIAVNVQELLQEVLDSDNEGAFTVTRVVVRAITTDPGIEESIKAAIANQKKLEAKQIEVQIAEKDAEIEIARARGLAEANRIIDESLSESYLQHEQNIALQKFAENGSNHTIVMPASMGGANLLISPNR